MQNSHPDVHWYCKDCQKPAVQAVQLDMEIKERCDQYMAAFTGRVEDLEAEMKRKTDKVEIDTVRDELVTLEASSVKMR